MYEGNFSLSKTGDTFLDMSKWGKGIVFVNGHNESVQQTVSKS